ncbi:hypothetical protein [Phenylobacterium sp.]|uniref:hypothetical protein n=1 Tax=Phenylobacterium sp. TaxID=1871053 RepID=UPI002EDB945D
MLTTYEFYVAQADGAEPRFVPVLCESERELVRRARELLGEKNAAFVEVRRAGQPLFRLDR